MSSDASPNEPTAATAAGWVEKAADELSPAAFDVVASSASAERSLITAFPAAVAAHHMDLLTMQ